MVINNFLNNKDDYPISIVKIKGFFLMHKKKDWENFYRLIVVVTMRLDFN